MSKIINKINRYNYYLNKCLYFEDKHILSYLDEKIIKDTIEEEVKKNIMNKCGRITNERF